MADATLESSWPLIWAPGGGFRPIAELPDLADWTDYADEAQ